MSHQEWYAFDTIVKKSEQTCYFILIFWKALFSIKKELILNVSEDSNWTDRVGFDRYSIRPIGHIRNALKDRNSQHYGLKSLMGQVNESGQIGPLW